MQNMQITYFNLLKNKIIDAKPDQNGSLCCLIQAILADTEGQAYTKMLGANQEKNVIGKEGDKNVSSESKDEDVKIKLQNQNIVGENKNHKEIEFEKLKK